MALDRNKKQDLEDEIAGNSDSSASMGAEDLSVDAGAETAPAQEESPLLEETAGGSMDAATGSSLDDLIGQIDSENSPLIPDPLNDEADEKALENEARDAAIAEGKALKNKKGMGAMSAKAAKQRAEQEKKKANKTAALKAESAEKRQKEKTRRQRTIASQQNKTARERILRGETGARGRMFNRLSAKFQIPDAPVNFPPTGGSGTQFN